MIIRIICLLDSSSKMLKSQKNSKVKVLSILAKLKTKNNKMMIARMIKLSKHQEKNKNIVI